MEQVRRNGAAPIIFHFSAVLEPMRNMIIGIEHLPHGLEGLLSLPLVSLVDLLFQQYLLGDQVE